MVPFLSLAGLRLGILGTVSNENKQQIREVPLIDLGRQNARFEEELVGEVRRLLASGQFILGKAVEDFEAQLADAVGSAHAVGVSSGTDALVAALMALGIGPGDEVALPAFTFFATAGSVARVGATPVFVDVCPVCFNIDTRDLADKVGEKTAAIIPVHLFGQSAEMDEVGRIAAELGGVPVIEDCAQAIGAAYRGRQVGTLGTVGCFSFFPTKNLSGFGDAGAVTTDDPELAEVLRRVRNHGMHPKYEHGMLGGNFRIDALQAAMLGVKLPHLGGWLSARAQHARSYDAQLGGLPGVVRASEADCCCFKAQQARLEEQAARLVLPVAYGHNAPTWNQYTIRVLQPGGRDALVAHLRSAGVGCEVYYPKSLDQQPCFAAFRPQQPLAVANLLAQQCLSLPVFPELEPAELQRVVEVVAEWLESGA